MGTLAPSQLRYYLAEVGAEVERAVVLYPGFQSEHEGYAVILEELDELWTEIKERRGRGIGARKEALQVAAMAVRYLLDLEAEP
jgi:hypothetical protein